jgi:hypothetical protein
VVGEEQGNRSLQTWGVHAHDEAFPKQLPMALKRDGLDRPDTRTNVEQGFVAAPYVSREPCGVVCLPSYLLSIRGYRCQPTLNTQSSMEKEEKMAKRVPWVHCSP